MMRNVWAVIRREYLQRVRSRWFLITTIGGPIFMLAMTVLPVIVAERGQQSERQILVVDETGLLYDGVAPRLEEAGYSVEEEPWAPDVVEALRQRTIDGEVGGFLVFDQETLTAGRATMYASSRPSALRRLLLREGITRSALELQLGQAGIESTELLEGGDLTVEVVSEGGAGMDEPRFMVAYLGTFLLYMVILLYAVSVMRATLEEKTSRIVEVVISSMKPWHLMLGKILGVGAVGLTQMAVWFGSGALIASAGIPALAAARPELLELSQLRDVLPGLGMLALFVGYFLFGFFIFAGLYAAVGAMCNTDEEAQQAQFPVMVFLIIPILFVMPVIQDPHSTMAVSLSLVPLFSPILMWARIAGGGVPAWQVGLSFVLMALAVVAVAWVAGRIYKVGILMAGKRPTIPELWRWVREA